MAHCTCSNETTLSPNPAAVYHTNHPERGGARKPEVDFSTRTPVCVCVCACVCACVCVCVWGGGGYLATLRNKSVSRTELNQTKHPIGDFQGCPQGYKFLFFV